MEKNFKFNMTFYRDWGARERGLRREANVLTLSILTNVKTNTSHQGVK